MVLLPEASMLICALSGAIDTAIYEWLDGSSWGTILINSTISAFLGAAAGADSFDFVRTKKLLLQAVDAKKAITKGIHPSVKKTLILVNNNIVKARKQVVKSAITSLFDDVAYEFLYSISSDYISLIRGV